MAYERLKPFVLYTTMMPNIPYREQLKRQPDFRVRYELLPYRDHFRVIYQGVRWDFRYQNDGVFKHSNYIIWPEFEDGGRFVWLDSGMPIPQTGTASMWMLNDNFREYHRTYFYVGKKGFMCSGGTETAQCEVIELLGLV